MVFDEKKLDTIEGIDKRWAWLEIDMKALMRNMQSIRRHITPGVRVMAVVKADAYGHGAVRVARTLSASGADFFGVATVDEALELRRAQVTLPILLLSQPPLTSIPHLLAYRIIPSVYSPEFAIQYAEMADSIGMSAPYHLAVNTGMNRIGVRYDAVIEFLRQVSFHRALDLQGVFTHFATADEADTFAYRMQARRFYDALNAMTSAGFNPGLVHCANSAAALRFPDVQFDMIRWGIGLYGYYPSAECMGSVDLTPVMSVHARVTDERILPLSEGVSYGLHYRGNGLIKICTVPVGYADG
ncbi:MAG: alanine racemase, partial [Eggerthellaceae bacterium]|nr:alanine racemase [Eggerthellaceae bacterium]